MGMFDYVVGVPETKCQKCGNILGDWQSKDGPRKMIKVHFTRICEFHTICSSCGEWHQFESNKLCDPDWTDPKDGVYISSFNLSSKNVGAKE